MNVLIKTSQELTLEQITAYLRQLRQHAVVESSHFSVAAIIQVQQPQGQYAYVCGVNVEHREHNRLSMHAEQNAIVAAQSLLGDGTRFINAWVMGALNTIDENSDHELASNFVRPCGHCRQILMSFSLPETKIYSITVKGVQSEPEDMGSLLPNAFSERDLANDKPSTPPNMSEAHAMPSNLFSLPVSPKAQPKRLLQHSMRLSDDNIRLHCQATKPHIINATFETSAIHACMILVETKQGPRYFSGALVQDIAFLTTDAIFASVGQAVTALGGNGLLLKEIHLFGPDLSLEHLDDMNLSGCELSHLKRFSDAQTLVTFHNTTGSSDVFTLAEVQAMMFRPKAQAPDQQSMTLYG